MIGKSLLFCVFAVVSTGLACEEENTKTESLISHAKRISDSETAECNALLQTLKQEYAVKALRVPELESLLESKSNLVRKFAVERLSQSSDESLKLLLSNLATFDGTTSDVRVGAYLDIFRDVGQGNQNVIDAVTRLLKEDSNLYKQRDKLEVIRLRAFCVIVLSDIGITRDAWPYIVDLVVNADDQDLAIGSAAAARAAATLGPAARKLAPYLVLSLIHISEPTRPY